MHNDTIKNILNDIDELKNRLKEEIAKEEQKLSLKIEDGKVQFSEEILKKQLAKQKDIYQYLDEATFANIITAPIIYMMIIPALILDLFLFVYVKVVFRVYKFPDIKRGDYIVFDRQYLGYLNPIEKLNCLYCSYFNGLINYTAKVAGRTELYFCPIKHLKKIAYMHDFYHEFLPYGDEKSWQTGLQKCQDKAKKEIV